jgi:hypothetical protein
MVDDWTKTKCSLAAPPAVHRMSSVRLRAHYVILHKTLELSELRVSLFLACLLGGLRWRVV